MEKAYISEMKEKERLQTGIDRILARFKLFGVYTLADYEAAMRDLAALREGEDVEEN